MIPVRGRIVDFLIDRCSDGYAEFYLKVITIKTARDLKRCAPEKSRMLSQVSRLLQNLQQIIWTRF